MATRRAFLQSLPGLALAASATAAPAPLPGLRSFAARRGLVFGAAAANYQLKDADFIPVLAGEAGMLVPEYELKRNLTEPLRGAYDFSAGDALWAFARDHGQGFRGHPLVWYAANPPWLEETVMATRDERLLTDYVTALAGHFRGRMHSWDVVNEALRPEDGQPGGMRNSFWYRAFGVSHVDMAFHAARAADPDAQLVYNDFGCEAGAPENDQFRAATLDFLEGLRARGVPVQGYGMQAHLAAFGPRVDQRKLARFLDEIRAMGLKILVTELDVGDRGGPIDFGERDRAVAEECRNFLDVVLDNPATTAILTWGLSDRYLRADGVDAMLFARGLRKLPIDAQLQRLPLWRAMADAFGRRSGRLG